MSCPKTLEILQLLENKLYSDLGRVVIGYLTFKPPTPEQIWLSIIETTEDKHKIFAFKRSINNYNISPTMKVEIREFSIKLTWLGYWSNWGNEYWMITSPDDYNKTIENSFI